MAHDSEAAEVGGWYTSQAASPEGNWAAGEIIVRFDMHVLLKSRRAGESIPLGVAERLFSDYGLHEGESLYGSESVLWQLPADSDVPAVARELSRHPAIVYAEPNYIVCICPPSPPILPDPTWRFVNPADLQSRMDVDGDAEVTPADALRAINHLNQADAEYALAVDVNRDGSITSLDPLLIINHLSRNHLRSVAVQQATHDLAQRLMTSPQEIHTDSVTETTWPDTHLGLGYGDAVPREVDGFKIMLRNRDDVFEYRSGIGLTVLNLGQVELPPAGPYHVPRDRWIRSHGFDEDGTRIVESKDEIRAWEASLLQPAINDLAGLLLVSPDAIKVVSAEPVHFSSPTLGIGRGGSITASVPGLRITLSYELDGADLLFEYRAAHQPVLVLGNLPQID